jgi:DNA-binding GntR family transcriptional regulator
MPALSQLRRGGAESAPAQAYQALRDAIVRVDLVPGQRLSENEIAAQLGVSRTPVREAIARLRDEQLVRVVPQLGTFVSPISVAAVGDAQFVREALECAAVRRAAENAGSADVELLEQLLAEQERARVGDDLDSFYHLDDSFHQALCDLSRHPTVWSISQRAKSHLNRVRRLSLVVPSYMPEMIDEHRQVVDAVTAHDPDAAELALRYHLREVLRELPRIRGDQPDYFEPGELA